MPTELKIRILKLAQQEIDASFEYYEQHMTGLGYDFLHEILAGLKRIEQNPEAWHSFSARTRRCLVNRYPYGIIYQIRKHEILVVAVAHLHRKPGYWKNRL